MKTDTPKAATEAAEATLFRGDEVRSLGSRGADLHSRLLRGFIEELLEAERDAALGPGPRRWPETGAGGRPVIGAGHRHGWARQPMGTFGPVTARA